MLNREGRQLRYLGRLRLAFKSLWPLLPVGLFASVAFFGYLAPAVFLGLFLALLHFKAVARDGSLQKEPSDYSKSELIDQAMYLGHELEIANEKNSSLERRLQGLQELVADDNATQRALLLVAGHLSAFDRFKGSPQRVSAEATLEHLRGCLTLLKEDYPDQATGSWGKDEWDQMYASLHKFERE